MDTIETRRELVENLSTLERYMNSAFTNEREFHRNLVKMGICFVGYQKDGRYLFGPSRFVGYKQNAMLDHQNNDDKDGKETNPAIDRILGRCGIDVALEMRYRKFCTELGFRARDTGSFGVPRKFWRL